MNIKRTMTFSNSKGGHKDDATKRGREDAADDVPVAKRQVVQRVAQPAVRRQYTAEEDSRVYAAVRCADAPRAAGNAVMLEEVPIPSNHITGLQSLCLQQPKRR